MLHNCCRLSVYEGVYPIEGKGNYCTSEAKLAQMKGDSSNTSLNHKVGTLLTL